jgi:chaperonin GroEL
MPRGESKIINHNAAESIMAGAKEVFEAVSKVYGATSSNVAIQRNYGYATVTHDGVSVAKEVYLANEDEDIGAGLLVQASEKSNSVSGDGTSATVMLGYHIMEKARQRAAAGFNLMGLRRGINRAAIDIKTELNLLAEKVSEDGLIRVATISASDPEVGKLVADTVNKVGGVGITVEEYEGLGVIQKVVDGVYFEKGWQMPHFVTNRTTEEAVHTNPNILVVEKKLAQNQDIVPIIEMVFKNFDEKTLIIIGNVDGQALETCALTNLNGGVRICTIRPPVYGDQELPFLEDIAAMTGGKLVAAQLPADKVSPDYLGSADKIIVAKDHTTLFGAHGVKEDIEARIENINTQLQSDAYNAFQKERMEFRLAKLQGKIGIIRVGGATENGVKEMRDRVEDAVHATRAAKEQGIVAGGATTLARLSRMPVPGDLTDKNEIEGFRVVTEALAEPFKQLMVNSGQEDAGYRFRQVVDAKYGYGFDLNDIGDEPVDLFEAGVLDPVKVIKSVVENACEVAGIAITIPTTITIDRKFQMDQVKLNQARMQQ